MPASTPDELSDLFFGVALASCLIVSSILLLATTLFLPAFQYCLAIAPAALVVSAASSIASMIHSGLELTSHP
jgi:hypothetical protein